MVKKVNAIDSNKQNFLKKIKDGVKKVPETSEFMGIKYFNGLTKINFNARMEETSKNLKTKNQVETARDLGQRIEKTWNNFKRLIQVDYLVKYTFMMMDHKII